MPGARERNPAPLLDPAVRSVLLLRLRVGMGDLLCTAPALRALREARPDLHVALCTWTETAAVVDRLPGVDELVGFPGAPGIPERTPDGTLPEWLAAQRERGWDLVVECYGDNPAAGEVARAVGARVVAGFAPTRGPRLDPALHLPYPHRRHEVDRHLDLLELLGLPPGADRSLSFPLTAEDEAGAAALGLDRFVVLHPGATSPSRLWPAERFAAVGDALAARGLAVAVGGVPSERATTAEVLAAMRAPAVDLTGRTSLGEYAVLLRDAEVVVANDTGTAHLAAAVGGRTVTVFQSGDPVRWRHAPHLQVVVREEVGCNPCPHLACPLDFRCALRIGPERVLAAVDLLLSAGTPPTPARPSAGR